MSDAAVQLRASLARAREGLPYPGFRPFRRDEWPIFFGRERQVQTLLDLLAEQRFVCVHGPSGGGKSSLIEAGLMATLARKYHRSDTAWCNSTFRPGTSPLWNLARAVLRALRPGSETPIKEVIEAHSHLVRPGGSIALTARKWGLGDGNLLLVVDQFEELFRFRALDTSGEAQRFVDLLLGVFDEQPKGIQVLMATRTDFLVDCSEVVGLAEAVNAAPYMTPTLTEDELRAAISGPAELHGGKVEDALVEQLLRDSADAPDRLPILQHTLMRCWDVAQRRGTPGALTLELYKSADIVSVRGALNSHAEEVMKGPELRGLEHEVGLAFKALTELDGQGRAIRRPLTWAQLLAETGFEPPADQQEAMKRAHLLAEEGDDALARPSEAERQSMMEHLVAPLRRLIETGHRVLKAPRKADRQRMESVVNRFRAEGIGFLGRPSPEERELKSDTVVDLAHEALIRRWLRMNRPAEPGTGGPRLRAGWLWEQAADGNLYRALLLDARSAGETIGPHILDERFNWWERQPRTPAWARRMAADRDATEQDAKESLDRINHLFERSGKARARQRWFKRGAWGAVCIFSVILLGGALLLAKWQAERDIENGIAQQRAADLQRFIVRSAQLEREVEQLKALQGPSIQQVSPIGAPPVSPDQAAEVAATARPLVQAPALATSAAEQACKGAIWIGSATAINLRFVGGAPARAVVLGDIQSSRNFVSTKNVRLRRGLPKQEGYVQQEAIGIVPEGAQITARGEPVIYARPNGPQYWLDIGVSGQICSLVYFQFAGGTAAGASDFRAALEKQGYLVPGQEQLSSAQGLAEVRYYYAEDFDSADQLAEDAQAAAKKLGLAKNRELRTMNLTNWPRQKPPRGTLELWLDLSNR